MGGMGLMVIEKWDCENKRPKIRREKKGKEALRVDLAFP